MHIHATEPRRCEDVLRQDTPVGNDQRDVDVLLAQPGGEVAGLQLGGLHDGEPQLEGALLHRRRRDLEPASGRLVGLTHHGDHVRDLHERVEAGHRKLRRAEEHGAEPGRLVAHPPISTSTLGALIS